MASWDNYVILSRWEHLNSLSSLAPRFLIGNAHRSEPSEPLTFLRMIEMGSFSEIIYIYIYICKIKSRRIVKSKEAAVQFVFDNKTNVLHVATRFMAEATSSLDGIPGPLMPRCRIRGQVLVYHIACRRSIVTVNQFCRFCIRANAFPNK